MAIAHGIGLAGDVYSHSPAKAGAAVRTFHFTPVLRCRTDRAGCAADKGVQAHPDKGSVLIRAVSRAHAPAQAAIGCGVPIDSMNPSVRAASATNNVRKVAIFARSACSGRPSR